jgi:cytochrome c peroxidase
VGGVLPAPIEFRGELIDMKSIFSVVLAPVAILALIVGVAEVGNGQGNVPALSALPLVVTAPPGNPPNPAKVALGRLLFWDPILSGSKDVACATCHHPKFGYAENLDVSIGVNGVGLGNARQFASPNAIPFVKRNSQTILNAAFNGIDSQGRYDPASAPMFWDVRAQGLEAQALLPIKTFEEMRGHAFSEENAVDGVVARLRSIPEYRLQFTRAFGGDQAVSAGNLGKALAAFQRTIVANNSPFDRYMRGDSAAMTGAQIQGMQRFERAGCMNCHSGPMFSDYKLHVLGVPDNQKLPDSDQGANQSYAFRTASLRNLAYTAPYMHSGAFATLRDVLAFYNGNRRRSRNGNVGRDQLDPLLLRLRGVNNARGDLIEFLNALNDDSFDGTIPTQVPSGLHPGGRIE